jgi:homoserine kinase
MEDEIRAFAPATVANLGPGFDVLGVALGEPGDRVRVRRREPDGIELVSITGDGGRLPRDAASNTAGIAAAAVLKRAGVTTGLALELEKGLPLGSGLGSSAASAAAAAWAVNRLLGGPLGEVALVEACLDAESAVSGRHADNVAAAILGGIVLVRCVDPLHVVRLPVPAGLALAVVTPRFELETRRARAVLPGEIALGTAVANQANLAGLVAALHSRDLDLLSRCLEDRLATPFRAPLIPGATAVMRAARDAGALGSGISGSGPTIFALCEGDRAAARAAGSMIDAFRDAGLASEAAVSTISPVGAREEPVP